MLVVTVNQLLCHGGTIIVYKVLECFYNTVAGEHAWIYLISGVVYFVLPNTLIE